MENIHQGLLIAAEGMAATFIICLLVIGLSALTRLLAGYHGRSAGEESPSVDDGERAAVIAAVAAVMDDRPFRLRSMRPAGSSRYDSNEGHGGEWERSAREEAARTQGGN